MFYDHVFSFMYMSILSKLLILHIHPLSHVPFMHIHLWTRYVLDMYVYFSLYLTYICLEEIEFSNILYFFKPIFENPNLKGRLDGRPCTCLLYSENHFKLEHDWVIGYMRYTLDIVCVSIGIIEFFQLVSLLTFFLYTHICFYICMLSFQTISISIGI